MKILMLAQSVDSYKPGSAGFIIDWVRLLAKRVDHLTVLTYHYNPREKMPTNTEIILIGGNNFLFRSVSLFWKTLQLAGQSDVIFAHILEVFGIIAGICGKIVGKKSLLWYCQGYDLRRHYLAKTALFLVDKILTATPRIRQRYALEVGKWVNKKTTIIGHGINLDHYQKGKIIPWPAKGQPVKLLYAGRISPIKDIPTLKKAVKLVKANVKLEIISRYSYYDNFKIFKSANIFLMPSLSKSLDKTYLEALASGIPAVGTDIGYPFMKEKFPQLIFGAGNPDDLAKKISWIINHRRQAQLITARAQKYVQKNFNLDKLMVRMIYQYESISR